MAFVLSENFKAFINTSFLLLLCFFFTSHIRSPTTIPPHYSPSSSSSPSPSPSTTSSSSCLALQELGDAHSKCLYLKATEHSPCVSQGYINYLHVFYCLCGGRPSLGYALLALWLLVLFYLLANTASRYFCSSVESLSKALRLSPAIAGATLLSLGNGSPDVFASVISFRSGSAEVGLSSVLGGAFFVSCVVVGIINISVSSHSPSSAARAVRVDRLSFVRDVLFFVAVLSSLFLILLVGRITVWGAACFASLYFVYVAIVSVTHLCREKCHHHLSVPILVGSEELDEPASSAAAAAESKQSSVVAIQRPAHPSLVVEMKDLAMRCMEWSLYFMDMPLYLPRRLTIPDVSGDPWSRRYAVASATLAPVLLAALWNSKRSGTGGTTREGTAVCLSGALAGLALGLVAARTTTEEGPPRKCLFPWLAGGFLMSVLWTYVIAEELVGLLVSLGYVLGVGPGVLGLTVLAWGNSIGDLMANVAMATAGGADGAQIAMSGCYAGPIFNTLAGLGGSLAVSAWGAHPEPFAIPVAPALFEILGFMIAGLVWALVMVPRKGMKMDRAVGVGLLAIYLCFLSLRLSQSLGLQLV